MTQLDRDILFEVAPNFDGAEAEAQRRIIEALPETLNKVLDVYDITTPLRIAHFLAQITHECAGFRTTEEFASGAAYEGRADLGNTQPGDGVRYKGRGLLQLTGRANYRRYGALLDLPLEDQPTLAADPLTSLRIACEYWRDRDLNALCDGDDLHGITRIVNGGLNGLDDRQSCLFRAKAALEKRQGATPKSDGEE